MKAFFLRHRKLHLWLLADLVLLAAFFLCRSHAGIMTALASGATAVRRFLGGICYLAPFSVMEALCVALVVFAAAYLAWSIAAVVRRKTASDRLHRVYSALMGAVCVGLTIYVGFCGLWGVHYYTPSFQDLSGIYAQPVAEEDLLAVTRYFADRLTETADGVERDEQGRFAVPREVMAVDGDAFDYIFYTYGLQLYGNMPLVEPPETKEEKRIEDFVIAVDTSMSTSGELVRQFLACTYAILRSTETFTRKVNIRILQCDDQVRADTVIHDLEELKTYMENFRLAGGSATDFRPVFAYVAQLQAQGEFTNLRGLVYFTDGMGIYPKKRPPYDTAFVLLEEPPLSVKMPPWAIRLVLTAPALEKARQETQAAWTDDIDWDELPQL